MCNLGNSYIPKLKTTSALLEMTKSSSNPLMEEAQRKDKKKTTAYNMIFPQKYLVIFQ